MAAKKEAFTPRDFVYQGRRRLTDGTCAAYTAFIKDDGDLGLPQAWNDKPHWKKKSVGAVYTGAEFDEGQAKGLAEARWSRMWPNAEDRIEWQARDQHALDLERAERMEADTRKMSDIETVMLPLRRRYEVLRKKHDRSGMYALERAVQAALLSAPRATEKEADE